MKARWKDYVAQQMQGSQRELAERSGAGPASISRWLKGKPPSAEEAIRFARGVGLSPVQALTMAGYLTPREAGAVVSDLRLSDINDVALLDELRARAVARATGN